MALCKEAPKPSTPFLPNTSISTTSGEVILAGDLFYERAASGRLLDWLQRARRRGVDVLIADASRPFAPKTGVRVISEETFATDPDLEGVKERLVRLLSLEAPLEPVPG